MLLLTSTSDVIKVITAAALQTDVHASWMDLASGVTTPGRTNTSISTATTTTVVAAPAASTYRNIKTLVIRNADASNIQNVTVEHFDGTTTVTLIFCALLAGESLQFLDKQGFLIFDNAGNVKLGPSDSKFISATLLTNTTSSSFVSSPRTNFIHLRMVGGGAQGGGAAGGSSLASAGSGGGAGAYTEKWFAATPNTSYTYLCGAGGSTSTGANTGQVGSQTQFIANGITITASGGTGGTVMAAGSSAATVVGGSGAGAGTAGDVNGAGEPGGYSVRLSGTLSISGAGGSTFFGGGGNSVSTDVVGNNATGFGAGGGGSNALTTTARNGGAGTQGCIYIEEFT